MVRIHVLIKGGIRVYYTVSRKVLDTLMYEWETNPPNHIIEIEGSDLNSIKKDYWKVSSIIGIREE